jgi:hypothetical protein
MMALVIDTPEGNQGVVIFASFAALNKWREVAEEKGINTYGALEVVSRVDALLGVGA